MTIVTEAQFNSLSFFKVNEVSNVHQYIKQQYSIFYNTITGLANIVYGRNGFTAQQKFYGVVDNFADLQNQMTKNNIS